MTNGGHYFLSWTMALAALLASAPLGVCAALPETLWVLDPTELNREEQTLAATLQGVLNREQAVVWLDKPGVQQDVLRGLQREGVTIRRVASPWQLLSEFQNHLTGMVLYDADGESLNVATTICGLRDAVAVTPPLTARGEAMGLKVVADARTIDQSTALKRFGTECSPQIIVHQSPSKHFHLRDFAVAQRAFVFATEQRDRRVEIIESLGQAQLVYGWGKDEATFVEDVSRAGGAVVPADWAQNLSALQHLPVELPEPRKKSYTPARTGERVVTFVMSDGDNVQWTTGAFGTHPGFWGSPLRGEFNMTWEMAPQLASVAPRILARYMRESAHGDAADTFVAGPSGAAYYFPHASPNSAIWAARSAEWMSQSRMAIATIINRGGDMSDADALLDRTEVSAVFYKDYAPYNKRAGSIRWHNGKPCIAFRYLLWEPQPKNLPEGVAAAIGQLPANAVDDTDSFALVNVHAWSFRDRGGPLEAVRQTISLLPANTRVVTADEFVALLTHAHQRSSRSTESENP